VNESANRPCKYTSEAASSARSGEERALAEAFANHRAGLLRLVETRLDPRLRGRVDASDVVQEAYVDAARRYDEWSAKPCMPLLDWIRFLTRQKLVDLSRLHLGAQRRDVRREVRRAPGPASASVAIAERLAGDLTTPSQGAIRSELAARLADALDRLDPADREVLVLRHFEQRTNDEVAATLGLTKAGASNRYVRALRRLRAVLPDPSAAPESTP